MAGEWNFKKQALGLEITQKISSLGVDDTARKFLLELKEGNECFAFKKQLLSGFLTAVEQSAGRLKDDEKAFLFCYLKEFCEETDFRVSDRLLALLVTDDDAQRNAYLAELIRQRENSEGFFEETAAKLVTVMPEQSEALAQRAINLCQRCEKPKGVLFALALLKINQIKLSIRVLEELAKKGAATTALMFVFRILPKIKGEEKSLADIFLLNLSQLKKAEQTTLCTYTAELYLSGARAFYECGAYREAKMILEEKRLLLLIGDNLRLKEKYCCLRDDMACGKKPFDDACNQEQTSVYPQYMNNGNEKYDVDALLAERTGDKESIFDVSFSEMPQEQAETGQNTLSDLNVPEAPQEQAELQEPSVPEAPQYQAELQEPSVPEAAQYQAEVQEPSVPEAPQNQAEIQEPSVPEASQEQTETGHSPLSIAADVLKITSEEVEQHFENIKRLSKEAIFRAETQAKKHAKSVGEHTLKLKKLVQKLPFSKKSRKE